MTHSTNSVRLLKYYRACILEQIKTSALKNISADKKNVIIKLSNADTLLCSPEPLEFPQVSQELLNLKIKSDIEKDPAKELIYGTVFVKGTANNKQINAPLLYCPCEIIRTGKKVCVKITGEISLNMGILSVLENDISNSNALFKEILNDVPKFPVTPRAIQGFVEAFVKLYNDNELKITSDNAVIYANLPKVSSGIIRDYNKYIDLVEKGVCGQDGMGIINPLLETSLKSIAIGLDGSADVRNSSNGKIDLTYCSRDEHLLSYSQRNILRSLTKDLSMITAIQGGPGCGKTTLIEQTIYQLIANGKRVLVVGKKEETLDVIENKLRKFVSSTSPFYVRSGSREHCIKLANTLETLAMRKPKSPFMDDVDKALKDVKKKVSVVKETSIAFSNYQYHKSNNYMKELFYWLYWNHKCSKLFRNKMFSKISDLPLGVDWTTEYKKVFVSRIMQNLNKICDTDNKRKALYLARALKSGRELSTMSETFAYHRALQQVLDIIPCWLTTINNISETIPPNFGYFDYVIIDEASQVDLASVIPVLLRARRAIVVGDDRQLKSLSFIDRRFNENAKSMILHEMYHEQQEFFDNSKNTLYDFAKYFTDSSSVFMLTEYFRGPANFIEFSSEEFYGSNIKGHWDTKPESLTFEKIEGAQANKGGLNYKEANRVIDKIQTIIRETPANQTIGVVTPFRKQAEAIYAEIRRRIAAEDIESRQITVGTAHAFQGDERHHMIISWGIAPNSPVQNCAFVNNPNLFNVAITRASATTTNLCSVSPNELPDGLLKKYMLRYGFNG